MGFGLVVSDIDRSPAHGALARAMQGALLSFIRTGTPAAEGLPAWPPFDGARQMMCFDDPPSVQAAPPVERIRGMPRQVFGLD